jgi:hypothetical protein
MALLIGHSFGKFGSVVRHQLFRQVPFWLTCPVLLVSHGHSIQGYATDVS